MKAKSIFSEILALRGTPFYRWHPQLALRYLPVVEWIRKLQVTSYKLQARKNQTHPSILEVGSGGLGIAPYLKQPVTGVDIHFDPPIHPMLTPVVGDSTKLPMKDRPFSRKDGPLNTAYDVVISMDMLEHLPKEKRGRAISEMLRVARRAVVIGVPCGQPSLEHDRMIQDSYKKQHGVEFPFAEEHLKFGLPEETDILGYINNARQSFKKIVEISVIGNTNLNLRKFLMKGWMSKNLFVNVLFRKVFLLIIPIFRALDRPPYYRKIFFVKLENRKQ